MRNPDIRKLYNQLSRMDLGEHKKTEGIGPRQAEIEYVAGSRRVSPHP